ncbi:MAG: B12-binding domain-containing radical SAM protein [Nitrospirae bacterium]|nr:B12-binding domain-containing radical SAM protein [Nitrospirota bacterium]MBF0535797.1 B12-binding domain-containing radical SAM protein [Nitrospirota bacterium]MBF0617662.1 B12-binding domain-containing radical SAM protein [Nitrospirota bacterium]
MKKVLLIYPELGFVGSYVINVPISLVYVASKVSEMPDIEIEILDCRIEHNWKEILLKKIEFEDIFLVGISVMSGIPVAGAYAISKIVKGVKNIQVVWGGPYPTVLPEETLKLDVVDFCIRGFGSESFAKLVETLIAGSDNLHSIDGLCFKKNNELVIGQINNTFEFMDYKKLPYKLVEPFLEEYFKSNKKRVFPIYTSCGCPYNCAFCISPVWYKDNKQKWVPYSATDVVNHIEHLVKNYKVNFIYFYDDDTFVDVSHFSSIAKEMLKRKLKVEIGVRGIRVNEVKKMSDVDFKLLEEVGVRYIHIGVESGSQKILNLMKKGITVEQSLEINRMLAKYPRLTPMYNILCGIPTETIDDLKETALFMKRLSEENPNCVIFSPGRFIPYPGSKLYDLAIEHGFKPPSTPAQWSNLDQESRIFMPWYTEDYDNYISMLSMAAYTISNWESYLENYSLKIRFIYKVTKSLYKPVISFRINRQFPGFLLEYHIFNLLKKFIAV